jgi:hypothetical protein
MSAQSLVQLSIYLWTSKGAPETLFCVSFLLHCAVTLGSRADYMHLDRAAEAFSMYSYTCTSSWLS